MPETSQKSSFLICGNYGASNLGDEAILEGILTIIRSLSHNITVMSARPKQTEKLHHVHSVGLFPCGFRSIIRGIFTGGLIKTLSAMRRADIFILGGGGLFSTGKPMAVIIWFMQALCAKLFKKRIVCFGQGVGPLRSFWSRYLTKKVFQWAKSITVRDEYSKKILEQLEIKNVFVLPDPAFLLADQKWTTKKIAHEKYIVISLRPWSKPLQTKNIKIIAKFIDWISTEYGFKVFLLPFQHAPDNDTRVFAGLIGDSRDRSLQAFNEDFHKAIELISGAEAVIGMRLHSIIFASLTNTPFLALSYSQKVRSIAEDLEQKRFILEWNNLQLNGLKQKFVDLMGLHPHIQKILQEKSIFYSKRTHEYVKYL